ncbi:hypothetical protein MMC11_001608 [Xylographa trunciseda]|nr:hypothetical protein [Xylographa trunciseda]
MFSKRFYAALVVCSIIVSGVSGGRFGELARKGPRAAEKFVRDHQNMKRSSDTSTYRFLNSKTAEYRVESLPDVNYDIGEMYSGLVPITNNASRALFFVFQPTIGKPVDEVTIFLNGGPGCSSLDSFFQETGRFLWQPGTYLPVENPYSWVNETNMMWVDQPVGTGFSIGEITAKTQEETALDFVHFFKNFEDIFGIKNFKIYVTGESYAGRYVPYISAAMLNQKDTEYFNLQGALTYDPCIGDFNLVQEEIPAVPYVQAYNNLFNFNATFLAQLEALDESCGYAAYREKYLTFPPPGIQPPGFLNYSSPTDQKCDVFDLINNEAFENNPCFNIYEVNQQCPLLWDVLSFPTELVYSPAGATTYFNRTDVKTAMHAPDIDWSVCGENNVFLGGQGGPESEGDLSADPIQHVLPQVIEATNRVLVSNGDLDFIILTNGTLMAIQNMTWNGALGFQSTPSTPIVIETSDLQYQAVFAANGAAGLDGPQGLMGIQHFERGLMWAETYLSGHEQPEFQPRVALQHIRWLLGRTDKI